MKPPVCQQKFEFHTSHYQQINQARQKWLAQVLSALPNREKLTTALDVGCGAGYFSHFLQQQRFQVTGIDLRDENIAFCRENYPEIQFQTLNLDDPFTLPEYDLVLMFGILYHLRSPLIAIHNLCQSIKELGIISIRVAAGNNSALQLFKENQGIAHNKANIVAVPTLSALVSLIYQAGVNYVYLPKNQPDHPEWNNHGKHGNRVSLVISREPIDIVHWKLIPVDEIPEKWESQSLLNKFNTWLGRFYKPSK